MIRTSNEPPRARLRVLLFDILRQTEKKPSPLFQLEGAGENVCFIDSYICLKR